jgi:hypothetical protein
MKRIVDGLRYDSEAAIEVGSHDNIGVEASSQSDFNWWAATLYRTPKAGRYFIAGRGGPMTKFGKPAGPSGWSGGERLIPISKEEALQWAESYLDADVIEEHFGDAIEDA